MERNRTELGTRIRSLRKKKGLTQTKLGAILHVDYQTVSRWECDVYEPTMTLAVCLADALGVSLEYLVTGKPSFTSPCNVGDKIYEVLESDSEYIIEEHTVNEVATRRLFVSAYVNARDDIGNEIPYSEIGKTVFFTREEAEAALKERSET